MPPTARAAVPERFPRRDPVFDGLPPYASLDLDVESLIPYAQLLRDNVNRRLYPVGGTDLVAPSDDVLFDDALRTVLERMLTDRLAALSPADFATAYRSVNGDPAFADALERIAAMQRADVERQERLARMRHEATVCGRLRLAELAAGEVIIVALFDPAQPRLAAKRFAGNQEVRPLHRLLQVRMVTPATGEVEVVQDTWTGAIWSQALQTPRAEPLTRGRLGTRPASDPAAAIAPELTVHAPIVLALHDGQVLTPPQIVGYVETLDRRLLLDAP